MTQWLVSPLSTMTANQTQTQTAAPRTHWRSSCHDHNCSHELQWKTTMSNATQKSCFTVLATGTVTPATVTSTTCGSDLCLAVVPMMIASVLSGFRKSPRRRQPITHGSVLNSGPCNSFYCLGHIENVYDDDDEGTGYLPGAHPSSNLQLPMWKLNI